MASNPVFDRIEKESRQGYAGFGRGGAPAQQPTAGMASTGGMTSEQLQDLYNQPAAGPVQTKRLTIDDVVMKTAGLFAIVLVFAAVGWQLAPTGLGHRRPRRHRLHARRSASSSRSRRPSACPSSSLYAVAEGLVRRRHQQLLQPRLRPAGADRRSSAASSPRPSWPPCPCSRACCWPTRPASSRSPRSSVASSRWRSSATRSSRSSTSATRSSRNTRSASAARAPSASASRSSRSGWPPRCSPLDFDSIDRAIAAGAPEKYSWLLAHGLIVTLVWLYLEILRLLGRLRSN